jgi:uncharacterized membrane protein
MRLGWFDQLRHQRPLSAFWVAWGVFWGALAGLFGLAWLVAPEASLQWLWTEIVGPWYTAANRVPSATWAGATAEPGYTLSLEGFYVLHIVYALANAWYSLAEPLDVPFGRQMVYAITPGALSAVTARVLEDAAVFCRPGTIAGTACDAGPLTYLAISPLVFWCVYLGLCHVLGILGSSQSSEPAPQRRQLRYLVGAQTVLLGALLVLGDGWLSIALPWAALASLLADPAYAGARRWGWRHAESGMFAVGLSWLAVGVLHLGAWLRQPLLTADPNPWYGACVLGATLAAVGLLAALGWALRGRIGRLDALTDPLTGWVVGGHAVDAFAAFFSICHSAGGLCSGARFAGLEMALYQEKHPISTALLGTADGWGFVALKVLVPASLMVAAAPVLGDEEREAKIGFLILVIWYAGMMPGLRSTLRALMGI